MMEKFFHMSTSLYKSIHLRNYIFNYKQLATQQCINFANEALVLLVKQLRAVTISVHSERPLGSIFRLRDKRIDEQYVYNCQQSFFRTMTSEQKSPYNPLKKKNLPTAPKLLRTVRISLHKGDDTP